MHEFRLELMTAIVYLWTDTKHALRVLWKCPITPAEALLPLLYQIQMYKTFSLEHCQVTWRISARIKYLHL